MIHFLVIMMSTLTMAQSAMQIKQNQCGSEKNCRINIITSKTPLEAQCSGKLFGELECQMNFKAAAEVSDFTILCRDSSLTPHLDATVPVEYYSYRLTKITGSEGGEKLKVDPRKFYAFEHPAFKATLTQTGQELKGEMSLLLNKVAHQMDNVGCSISESVPSSTAQAQSESQF